MPEGDTIWRTAAGLRSALVGRAVVSVRPESLSRLEGTTLLGVDPVGKHLLMRFSGGSTLHSHMRMRGSWHLYRPGERWRRPEHQVRAVLDFGDRLAVCFAAPVVELVRDAARAVAHLGPDLLGDDLRLDEVVARARALGPVRSASCCSTSGYAAASATSTSARVSGSVGSTPGGPARS